MRLLDGGIEKTPEASLKRLCDLALEAQIYRECDRHYPFVLGAQPVRPVDLAAFYAAIANEGVRPVPYVVESIERDGEAVYRHERTIVPITSVDRAAFYQLKSMMQGVLARGTARSIATLSSSVAGKTGTSDDENDAWFVGFTNDVTVAVWLGYDNADGKRRTLGGGSTGGGVAVPIFEPVMQAVWAHVAPRTALAPPSPEAKRKLACKSIDPDFGQQVQRGGRITECFRTDQASADHRYPVSPGISRQRLCQARPGQPRRAAAPESYNTGAGVKATDNAGSHRTGGARRHISGADEIAAGSAASGRGLTR